MGWEDSYEPAAPALAQAPVPAATPKAPSWEDAYELAPQQPAAAPPREAKGLIENFQAGVGNSVYGLVTKNTREKLFTPEHAPWLEKLANSFGTVIPDLGIMIPAGFAGAVAGTAVGGPVGGIVGAGVGGFGPVEAMRAGLIEAQRLGVVQTPQDYWNIVRESAIGMAKGSAVGVATTATGAAGRAGMAAVMGAGAEVAGKVGLGTASVASRAGSIGTKVADVASQIVPMTLVPPVFQDGPYRWPDASEWTNGAAVIGALTMGHAVAAKGLESIKSKLQDTYVKTGKTPTDIIQDIKDGKIDASDFVGPRQPGEVGGDMRPPAEDMFGKVYNPTGTTSGVPLKLDRLIAEAQQLGRGGVPEAPDLKGIIKEIKAAGPLQTDMVSGIDRLEGLISKARDIGPLTDAERAEANQIATTIAEEARPADTNQPPNSYTGTYRDGGKFTVTYETDVGSSGQHALVRTLTNDEGSRVEHLDRDGSWKKGRPARTVVTGAHAEETGAERFPDAESALKMAADDADGMGAKKAGGSLSHITEQVRRQATNMAETRLTELMMKEETTPLTDAERAERVFLRNNQANPDKLAAFYKLATPEAPITRQTIHESSQRVHDDVLQQLKAVDEARQAAGLDPLGDEHNTAVAALVRTRVAARAARTGRSPEELYAEHPLQIRDEAQRDAEVVKPPEGAPTFAPPEVDLFGNPVEPEVVPRTAVENMATQEVPVDQLVLSKEVPQFKMQADEKGVIVPLGGKFDRTGVGPIQVWERTNGTMEVISGRHRLDLARRSGETTIPAQIHREADGFTAARAAALDAELNIREEQGNVADYVQHFQTSGITKEAANELGLLARAKGRSGFAIARDGTGDLWAAHRAGLLSDEAALTISAAAPGSERLQALGMAMVQEGKSALIAVNTMKAVELMAADRMAEGKQGDIFGFDDSAMREASAMAKKATSIQRKISEQISAVSGASRRPELARKMGVDVSDPEGIQKKIVALKQEQYLWDNWPIHPELVAQLREKLGQEPSPEQKLTAARAKYALKPEGENLIGHDVDLEHVWTHQMRHGMADNEDVKQFRILGKDGTPQGVVNVAFVDGKVSGIRTITTKGEATVFSKTGELQHKDYPGLQGWGEKAVRALAASAEGPLHLSETVKDAVAFWEKMGAKWLTDLKEHQDATVTFGDHFTARQKSFEAEFREARADAENGPDASVDAAAGQEQAGNRNGTAGPGSDGRDSLDFTVTHAAETPAEAAARDAEAVAQAQRKLYQAARKDQTETTEFKNWFGDSKVVDIGGNPLPMYHGSQFYNGFSEFNTPAFFTSDARGSASAYANMIEPNAEARAQGHEVYGSPTIVPVYLSIKNPYDAGTGKLKFQGEYIEPEMGLYEPGLMEFLQSHGYDGLKYEMYAGRALQPAETVYVPFKPEQIKSSVGNRGTFDANDPNILHQSDPWYSRLQNAVDAIKMGKAPVQGWKDAIKGMLANAKISKDEVEALQLNEWLDAQEGKVTKEQVAAYIKGNGLKVVDVTLGAHQGLDSNARARLNELATIPDSGLMPAQRQELDHLRALGLGKEHDLPPTHFSQWQLPGGQNYREAFITVPEMPSARDTLPSGYQFEENQNSVTARWEVTGPGYIGGNRYAHGGSRIEALENFNKTHGGGWQDGHGPYEDIKNPIMRYRFNERTDADGKRVMFLEEVQPPVKSEFANMPKYLQDNWLEMGLKRVVNYAALNGFDKVAWTTGAQQVERYTGALRNAVDAIEWTKTEKGVQITGYKSITFNDSFGKKYEVKREKVVDTTEKEDALSDSIGKAMAERIINDPAQSGTIEGENITIDKVWPAKLYDRQVPRTLEKIIGKMGGGKVSEINLGLGVKTDPLDRVVGMNNTRDDITNSQRGGWLETDAGFWEQGRGGRHGEYSVSDPARGYGQAGDPIVIYRLRPGSNISEEVEGPFQSLEAALARASELNGFEMKNPPSPGQQSIDITPAVRDKASAGMPLFQKNQDNNRGSYDIAENLITTLKGADKSTVVHELWHSWLEEMKADAERPDAPAQLKADWELMRKEYGIPASGPIPRAAHELGARTGERYLMEGKAPSAELAAIFERFKNWLLEIYKSVMNLDAVEINPELRGVLDRMLTVQENEAAAHELNVPKAYVEEAKANVAAQIVPPPEQRRKIEPGFAAEQISMQPHADSLPEGPGKAPDNIHVNYKYMNSAMDVKLAAQRMAEIDQSNIQKQRGGKDGVESWQEEQMRMEQHLRDVLGGGEDKLGILRGSDPNDPKINHKLRAMNQLAEGAVADSERLRDVVLKAGHDATVRQMLEYMASIERATMIQREFLGERAAVARAMNALKDITNGSGEIGRMLEAISGDPNKMHQAPRTEAEEQAYMKAKLDEILQNYRGKTVLEIAKLHSQIGTLKGTFKFAEEVQKATKWEMVVEGWKAGLLSGPVTHTTNLFGTGAFHAMRPAVDALAAIIGVARGASPGMGESDRASMSESIARLTGMLGGIKDGLKVAGHTFLADEVTGKTESYRNAIPGQAGHWIRTPLRAMAAEDALVSTMYERGELRGLAMRQAFDEQMNPATREFAERVDYLTDHPTDQMKVKAEEAATRMTFNAPLGEKGVYLQLFVQKWNLQWMIPFIRTPINVAKEMARMSPFAPIVGEWRAAIAKGGVERDRALAEMALGTGIMAVTVSYALSGSISGNGSPDQGKNRAKVGVWQPYSILIGDKWYEYGRIQPTGTLMGLAADMAAVWDHMTDEEKDKIPKMLAIAFSNAVTNQTFLQGITNVVNAMSEPQRFFPRFSQQMAGSLVPNIVGQPTAMTDPVVREVNGALEAIQARIPGMRQELLPKRDWLGEPVQTKERMAGVMPVREQQVSEDKVRLEATRLNISVAGAPKKTHVGKGTGKLGDVELTPEERDKFEKIGGQMAHELLTNIVNAPGYDQIPDMIKKNIFARVMTASHKIAALQALPMDKRMSYLQSISEKVQQALEPGATQ